MSKIVVPDGMLKAAGEASGWVPWDAAEPRISQIVEAALRWMSENPIHPTREQYRQLCSEVSSEQSRLVVWQRRMFIVPEPEVPEEIKDLQGIHLQSITSQDDLNGHLQILLVEAFRRGKKYVEDRQFIYDRDHK